MDNKYFIHRIDNCCFWCVGELSDFSFIVECKSEDDYDRATEIAERELRYWCDPETSPEPDLYRSMGYVEPVRDALEDARIQADYYVRMEV